MHIFHVFCALIVFIGAVISMDAAWAMADIMMEGMTLINLPACALLGKIAFDCLKDYESQKKSGKNPVFKAESVGFDEGELDFWN